MRQMRRGVHPTHCGRRRGIRCGGVDGAIVQGGRSPHVRERHAEGQSPGGWRPASQQVQHAAGRVRRDPAAQAWLNRALRDEQRKWFAADVIAVLGTPEPFREEDTDCRDRRTGSQFQQEIRRAVRACPRSSGSQGSPAADHRDRLRPRGGGAARAYYWTFAARSRPPARTRSDWLHDQEVFMRTFLRTGSLDARRSLLPRIELAKLAG